MSASKHQETEKKFLTRIREILFSNLYFILLGVFIKLIGKELIRRLQHLGVFVCVLCMQENNNVKTVKIGTQ